MAKDSFTNQVLAKVLELAATNRGEVTTDAMSRGMECKTRQEHHRMLKTLRDLHRQGRIVRLNQGVYGPVQGFKQPDKRSVMWRVLRTRRRVTVEDLVVMAEVSPRYAKEWLATLVKREVVRKQQQPGLIGTWQLINDTVEMPEDDAKSTKLREIRRKKKEAVAGVLDDALKNLQTIGEALSKARDVINTMEDGE
jgi:hypothetical protein